MINWYHLAASSLWVIGLALALAALSTTHWRAAEKQTRFSEELASQNSQRSLNIAGFLFCNGLALTSRTGWEKAIWFVLASYFLVQFARPFINHSPDR